MTEYFVEYTLPPGSQEPLKRKVGPYPTRKEANEHQRDIAGYAGITQCCVSEESV